MSRSETRNPTAAKVFGERLRLVQAERKLKTEEAARELDVGLRLYQMWRSGQLPGMKNLLKLAAFYGVSIGWLLGDDASQEVA